MLFNPIAQNTRKLISREGGSQKGLKQFNQEEQSEKDREKKRKSNQRRSSGIRIFYSMQTIMHASL